MKYNIESIKRKMLVKYPFFGSVVANVSYEEREDLPTAATDGKKIYYNPNFVSELSVEEQTFIFAHEVCHIAFNHILRSEGKDPELWNIATDAVINQFLKSDGLKMVEGGVDMEEAIDYDSEQLYEKLLQEKNQNRSESNEEKQEKSSKDVGHDTHSLWEDAVKEEKEEQSTKKESIIDKIFKKNKNDKESEKTEIEKVQRELEEMGERKSFSKNKEVRRKSLEKLKKEVSDEASKKKPSTNSNVRVVSNIGNAKPLVDWRYILREATKHEKDWSYRNATIEDGVVTANLEDYPILETEIVLDTSGSINEVLLKNFLRECKNIIKHTRLKVGCFDKKFYGFQEVKTEEDIENMKFLGGGGTDFNVAVNAFSKRADNKIIFTDGEANMPNSNVNAIWIVFGRDKINPKNGRVIYITPEQLKALYNYEQENETKRRSR